jgi:tRNA-specific 2-thiouridylase
MGADFVATGHYAVSKKLFLSHTPNSVFDISGQALVVKGEERTTSYLLKGNDPSKDQSYFLWTLRQEQLSKIIFPIGHLKKTEVRKLAKKFCRKA